MKHRNRRVYNYIALMLAFAVLLVSVTVETPVPVRAETTSEKIKKAEEIKKQTEAAKAASEDKKDSLEGEKAQLQSYLSQLNEDLTEISNNLSDLEAKIETKQAEIEEAKEQVAKAKEEEAMQYALMKQRIKFMYERGDVSLLEAFFSAKSYGDFLNKAEYVNRMEDYDQRMYQNLIDLREEIEENEAKLEIEEVELKALHKQAQDEESKVNTLVSNTNGSIAATNGAISAAELESAAYEAELKVQEQNLAALRKQLAEEQAMSAKAAKMAWRDISEVTFEDGDRDLLACLIYCEAGNQPYEGQVAVGAVVVNRMRSAAYPNTMVGVIYQNKQFSPVASGRLATRLSLGANAQCYSAADDAMKGASPVGNCLYFRTVIPEINGQIIGAHVFY